MNGKISKRIRIAARIISKPTDYRITINRLKKEYLVNPYHKRRKKGTIIQSHSQMLKDRQKCL